MKKYKQIQERRRDIKDKELLKKKENQLVAFKSPSPMNELCDYISQWEEKNLHKILDSECKEILKYVLNNSIRTDNIEIKKFVRQLYLEFIRGLNDIFKNSSNEDNKKEIDELKYNITKTIHGKLIESNISIDEFSNYCIEYAYKYKSKNKLFAWMLFGDEIINNLKNNSPKKEPEIIIETSIDDNESSEFLGRYYKISKEEKNDLSS